MMCINAVAPPSAYLCAVLTIVSTPREHTLFHGYPVVAPTFIKTFLKLSAFLALLAETLVFRAVYDKGG